MIYKIKGIFNVTNAHNIKCVGNIITDSNRFRKENTAKADNPFEFDSDRSPVIVVDWTGNFKKGEFTLSPTWVSKKKGMSVGKALLGGLATLATGGAAVGILLTNNEETFYKKAIVFEGSDTNWPKMTYLNSSDLSKFDNK